MKERSRILKSVWRILDERWVRHTVNTPPPNPPQDSKTLYNAKAHRVKATRSPRSAAPSWSTCLCIQMACLSTEHEHLAESSYSGEPTTVQKTELPRTWEGRVSGWGQAWSVDHLTAPRAGGAAPRTTALHISGKGRELRARVEN